MKEDQQLTILLTDSTTRDAGGQVQFKNSMGPLVEIADEEVATYTKWAAGFFAQIRAASATRGHARQM